MLLICWPTKSCVPKFCYEENEKNWVTYLDVKLASFSLLPTLRYITASIYFNYILTSSLTYQKVAQGFSGAAMTFFYDIYKILIL